MNEKGDKGKGVINKLKKYISLTEKALKCAEKAISKDENTEAAETVLDMAQRYYDDALYFRSRGMLLTALCSVVYAHGWLDCGSRLGMFKVKDSRLFVLK